MLSRGDVNVSLSEEGDLKKKNDEAGKRKKRGRPVKEGRSVGGQGMPELEVYMNCSQSNVSPDSGIQSVAGSPSYQSYSPSSSHSPLPPVLKPTSPQPSPHTIRATNADPILYPPRRRPNQQNVNHTKPKPVSNVS